MWIFASSQSTRSPSIQIFLVGVIGIVRSLVASAPDCTTATTTGGWIEVVRPGPRAAAFRATWKIVLWSGASRASTCRSTLLLVILLAAAAPGREVVLVDP